MGQNGSESTNWAQNPRERAIRELAGQQWGNVTRRQLLALGLSSEAIKARLSNGSYVARYRAVYAIAPVRPDPTALIAAAVLAGGPHALASHASAGYLWGLVTHWAPPPQITVTQGDPRPRHILTHRCPSLNRSDHSLQAEVRCTSRARTVLDLAPILPDKALTRLVMSARRNHHLSLDALSDVLERNPLHKGTKLLRPFIDDPHNPTASHLEDLFLAFIKNYNLPVPVINFNLRRKQPDAYFPDHNLIVELDGWQFHKDRHAFENDRERDAENLRHGTQTIRMTEQRLTGDTDPEARRLEEILAWLEKP